MRSNDSQSDDSQARVEPPDTFIPSGPLTLANAFRVVAVLCVVAGIYLFFEALQYAPMVGNAAYGTGALRLGIAVIVALFLLLGEKVCRHLDDYH
ncbi:hypothetical protein ACFFU2_08880 [Halomonas alkalicola]|uniref:Uncharacterized protein n=1 Tax=Halomonas alkalicola TaxID=1930622 RepID=A0ABY9H3A8_9GAMM|nr:hypothetical protein [Halomonas alkalicola]WLI72951.1 hypothetical protein B6N23_14510 [Halomonas alkalicola]